MLTKFVNSNTASTSGLGTLPSNTITNPKVDLKGITTRSGVAYQGPTIPTTSSSPPKVVERETEVTNDTVPPTNNGSTKDVQPPVVQPHVPNSEPVVAPTGRALIDVYEGRTEIDVIEMACEAIILKKVLGSFDVIGNVQSHRLTLTQSLSTSFFRLSLPSVDSQYPDAKSMFAAIKTRFRGNAATKKTQKILLKQQYENFSATSAESLDSIFNRLQKISKFKRLFGSNGSEVATSLAKASRSKEDQFRNQDNTRKQGNKEYTSKAMLAIDGVGFDWSDMAEEQVQTNMALMRFPDSEPDFKGYGLVNSNKDSNVGYENESYNSKENTDKLWDKKQESQDSKQESNIVCDKKSDDSKENSDNSLVKEQVSKDTSSFVESSLNVDKETVFPVDKKVESVKPKDHEKPVKKSVRFIHNVNTAKAQAINTARPKTIKTARLNSIVVNAVRVNQANAIKASACWVWRPTKPDSASITFKKHNYIDARGISNRCSRHMTGNIAYLSDFKEFDGGYVTFGGGAYGGRITGKGTLKTDSLDFEDLPDESQILLKIPRKDNMYNFDMKNIVPKETLTSKRRNRTLIEAAKTMLADSKLPTTFWAEAGSTACYVQNRVLVVKPHNKTPYELFRGFKPALSFIRPFGCHVTILNTLDSLGKFDGKSDECFFVGYSLNSKAFRVYNTRTRRVEENLHIGFLENKPMIEGNGPKWLFNIDSLTQSMNYVPVTAGTFSNESAGTQGEFSAGISEEIRLDCIVMPIWKDASYFDSPYKDVDNGESKSAADDQKPKEVNAVGQHVNTVSPNVNTDSSKLNIVDPSVNTVSLYDQDSSKDMFTMGVSHTLEATHVEFFNDEDEPEVDLGNIINSYTVPTTLNIRIHKDHPIENVIGDVKSSIQTRRLTTPTSEQGFLSAVYEQKTHDTLNTYLYACFLSQIEPISIAKALSDSSWVEAM
ncbi:putative ribonuclease H-like domain-containing protein [Tanacetum coccineum]